MFRKIILPAVLVGVLVAAMFFAALNPGIVSVDLGFREVSLQKPIVLALVFAFGWVFGLLCLGAVMIRMVLERRRLRKALRLAEAEIHALRSLPAAHAD